MLTKGCKNYEDNQLFHHALQRKSDHAWECLLKCASSIKKSAGWRIKGNAEIEEEDIMQDAAHKLWVAIIGGRYDGTGYHFCRILKMTFVNLCIDVYRKNKDRFTKAELDEAASMANDLPTHLETIILREDIEEAKLKINNELTRKQKQLYDLIIIEGRSQDDVAEIMGISKLAVTNLLYLVNKILKNIKTN
jgi:RNA polymerase sigma factor (sigma-70 family)